MSYYRYHIIFLYCATFITLFHISKNDIFNMIEVTYRMFRAFRPSSKTKEDGKKFRSI